MKQLSGKIAAGALLLGLSLIPVMGLAETALTAIIVSPAADQILTSGVPFDFVGSASGGNPAFYAYVWNFGDGTFGAGPNFSKTYGSTGQKTITLTVTDFDGNQASLQRLISVSSADGQSGAPQVVTIRVN